MEERIGYQRIQEDYARAAARFERDASISTENKELVLRFLRDAALGKTIRGRAKKTVGPSRRRNYLAHLTFLISFLGRKNLAEATQADLEGFVEALDGDVLRARARPALGNRMLGAGERLSPRYKVDIKVSVKKFYKWLLGNCKVYPDVVEWIDTSFQAPEIPALRPSEVERMVAMARRIRDKTIIQVLFDSGLRLNELINVRLKHVRMHRVSNMPPFYSVRVSFSKTLRRTVIMPMEETTKWLTLWLEEHPSQPEIQADGSFNGPGLEAGLFPGCEGRVASVLRRVSQRALGKRVSAQIMRHTSATYWCNKLPYFKFCKRFGWTMTSKMPQRYIDREGVDEIEVAQIYHDQSRQLVEQENEQLRAELALVRAVNSGQ